MAMSEGRDLVGSIYKGSVEDFEISCEPCKTDGNFVEASGYCKNCNEYLCLECTNTHCRPKPCRYHVVLDQQQMPKIKPKQLNVLMCTERCEIHPNECLKFFCKTHDLAVCEDCVILNHKRCDSEYISKLADGFQTSEEFTSIIRNVTELDTELDRMLGDLEHTVASSEVTVKKALDDIKHYRNEMNAYFDEAERTLAEKCDEVKKSNECESEKIKDDLKTSRGDLKAIHERLTTNVENTANIFVWAKDSNSEIEMLKHELEATKQLQLQSVEFTRNSDLIPDITTEKCLGTLKLSDVPIHFDITCAIPEHKADISIVNRNDNNYCSITGLVHVHENIIACTDWFNKAVKLIDIEQNKVLSTVLLMESPWDITCVTQGRLAVTLPVIHTFQYLEINNWVLKEGDRYEMEGECRGIDCIEKTLFLSFTNPPKVAVYDLCRHTGKQIQTDKTTEKIFFECPYYVAGSRDGSSYFVSDNLKNCLFKIPHPEEKFKLDSKRIELPHGMFVCKDGSVLVCTCNSVLVVSKDFTELNEIINEENGMHLPSAICYDEDNRVLCVRKDGDSSSDTIQTFRLVNRQKRSDFSSTHF